MSNNPPAFNFKYSYIYDKVWHLALDKKFEAIEAHNKCIRFIKGIKKELLGLPESEIVILISKYLEVKWKSKIIDVYVVNELPISAFSKPLTIKIHKDIKLAIHTLIHEATHVIIDDQKDKLINTIKYLKIKFPDELPITRIHIIVNSVADKVFEELYGKVENKRTTAILKKKQGLKRAYEIIDTLPIDFWKKIQK